MKIQRILFTIIVSVFTIVSIKGYSQLKVNSSGKVGINKTSPSCQLHVYGDFCIEDGSSIFFDNSDLYTGTYASLGKQYYWWDELWAWSPNFYNYPIYHSDIKLKKDIEDIGNTLDKLINLRPVSYKLFSKKEYSESIGKDSNYVLPNESIKQVGLIAQEVQNIFPEIVSRVDSQYLGIKYMELIPLLIKALQEQQEIIEDLSARIETIENDCCNSDSKTKSAPYSPSNENTDTGVAKLYQNQPNPFSSETTIRFEIPLEVVDAQLYICNMNGTLLKTININQRGIGNAVIRNNELAAGMYLYSLVNDGKIIDTKQMLLTE